MTKFGGTLECTCAGVGRTSRSVWYFFFLLLVDLLRASLVMDSISWQTCFGLLAGLGNFVCSTLLHHPPHHVSTNTSGTNYIIIIKFKLATSPHRLWCTVDTSVAHYFVGELQRPHIFSDTKTKCNKQHISFTRCMSSSKTVLIRWASEIILRSNRAMAMPGWRKNM